MFRSVHLLRSSGKVGLIEKSYRVFIYLVPKRYLAKSIF